MGRLLYLDGSIRQVHVHRSLHHHSIFRAYLATADDSWRKEGSLVSQFFCAFHNKPYVNVVEGVRRR